MIENKINRWQGKTALITGASSGIGAATARHLSTAGIKVILSARRVDRLEHLAHEIQSLGGQAKIIAADLADPSERQILFEEAMSFSGTLDLLINNAGLGWYGYAADMPISTAREVIQINVEASVELSLLALPRMRARNSGHIINIGSIVGGIPSQGVAVYAASKAFMDAFTTAIYRELTGTGVHVSVIRAGPVQTEFYDTAADRSNGLRIPVERFAVTDDLVAKCIWRVMQHPRRFVYIPGWMGIAPGVEAVSYTHLTLPTIYAV